MDREQRERTVDGLETGRKDYRWTGTEIKEWRWIWNRGREKGEEHGVGRARRERRWNGKSKKGVEMETNGKMRDERERSGDGLETDRNEMDW
jgi:hypothetical protein